VIQKISLLNPDFKKLIMQFFKRELENSEKRHNKTEFEDKRKIVLINKNCKVFNKTKKIDKPAY